MTVWTGNAAQLDKTITVTRTHCIANATRFRGVVRDVGFVVCL